VVELGLDPSQVGFPVPPAGDLGKGFKAREAGEIVVDAGEAHERVISFLEQLKIL